MKKQTFAINLLRSFAAREVFVVLRKDGSGCVWYPMRWTGTDKGEDEYSVEIEITTVGLYFYRFFARGLSDSDIGASWGDFVYLLPENTHHPKGWGGGVAYQIFCDRFNIGESGAIRSKPDCVYRDDWGGEPHSAPGKNGEILNNDFFGGNIQGIAEKLDYLKGLDVTAIYLNPIFEAASNHKYDTGNYFAIDPLFGEPEDFRTLCETARGKGIKIILDGVFNHTGSDSRYFNKYGRYDTVGAYQSPDSPYYPWYSFNKYPDEYDCWWGFKTLPAVNKQSPSFREFICGESGVIAHWLRQGAGGWRLDVADELSDEFLEALRTRVKSVNPDALIAGEVWENAAVKTAYGERRKYFLGKQLDSVMNYPFRAAIIEFVRDGNSAGLKNTINEILNCYPAPVVANLMNSLSTHDTPRALTVFSGDIARMKLAAVLQYTLPGFPCVFYGDEAGMTGGKDPSNRGCYPWRFENAELVEFYRFLGKLRAENSVFDGGGFRLIFEGKGVFLFARSAKEQMTNDKGQMTNEVIIGLNVSDRSFAVETGRPLFDLYAGKTIDGEIAIPAKDFILFR